MLTETHAKTNNRITDKIDEIESLTNSGEEFGAEESLCNLGLGQNHLPIALILGLVDTTLIAGTNPIPRLPRLFFHVFFVFFFSPVH